MGKPRGRFRNCLLCTSPFPEHKGIGDNFLCGEVCRFFAKVAIRDSDECWRWVGSLMRKDYGAFRVKRGEKWITDRAHCWSYRFFHGPIAKGQQVRHRCDVPNCVNPAHLLIGTNADNMHDMLERGGSAAQKKTGIIDCWAPGKCYRGHDYTPENTYMHPNGFRICRTCKRETDRGYHARRKQRDAARP